MVRTKRSAYAFARGERTGVLMISTPIEANTSSKQAVNLVPRSRMRNPKRRPVSSRSDREVPCDLGHPLAVRVGGDTEDVDNASL